MTHARVKRMWYEPDPGPYRKCVLIECKADIIEPETDTCEATWYRLMESTIRDGRRWSWTGSMATSAADIVPFDAS